MSPLPLHRRIGELAIVGCAGTSVTAELAALAREFDLGGVILFARNVESPGQVAEMAREIPGLARELPPWVSVDQEGGRVARLRRPFTEWPAMATLGRCGDDSLADRYAAWLRGGCSRWGPSSASRTHRPSCIRLRRSAAW